MRRGRPRRSETRAAECPPRTPRHVPRWRIESPHRQLRFIRTPSQWRQTGAQAREASTGSAFRKSDKGLASGRAIKGPEIRSARQRPPPPEWEYIRRRALQTGPRMSGNHLDGEKQPRIVRILVAPLAMNRTRVGRGFRNRDRVPAHGRLRISTRHRGRTLRRRADAGGGIKKSPTSKPLRESH